jgi:putative ABC transport system permease protein
MIYLPFRERPGDGWLYIRSNVSAGAFSGPMRRAVAAIDPDLPIWIGPIPLNDRLATAYWNKGLYGGLFLTFGVIALTLASLGVYGVMAHSVTQQIPAFGIRIALGATPHDILTLVFSEGMSPVAIGVVVGVAVSLVVNRTLQSELVRVSPTDPITVVVACAVLAISAALGCWIPARRAMRVDPVSALRHE